MSGTMFGIFVVIALSCYTIYLLMTRKAGQQLDNDEIEDLTMKNRQKKAEVAKAADALAALKAADANTAAKAADAEAEAAKAAAEAADALAKDGKPSSTCKFNGCNAQGESA